MKEYIVDSCAIVAFMFREKALEEVKNILNLGFEDKVKLIFSSVIMSEIYFSCSRKIPQKEVESFLEDLRLNYNSEIIMPSYTDCIEAGKYKVLGEIAYSDCFNLVLAKKYPNAEILTLDSEYKKFQNDFKIKFL